jgi:group I intron endonuclease
MKFVIILNGTKTLRKNIIGLCAAITIPNDYKACIYCLRHMPTNRSYVGHTTQKPFDRLYGHIFELVRGNHLSTFMQNVWNKYGNHEFEFEVLEFCTIEDRLEREQYWIDKFRAVFNVAKVAGSTLGTKRTPEHRKKFSEAQKKAGNVKKYLHTEEAQKRHKEVVASAEYREKMSKRMKGRIITDETKKRMSDARKKMIYENGWKDASHDRSTKETNKFAVQR